MRILAAAAVLLVAAAGWSHFVWGTVSPDSQNARFEFSESPGDSVIRSFVGRGPDAQGLGPKGAKAVLTQQGDFLVCPLARGAARLLLDYGVLDKREEGRGIQVRATAEVKSPGVRKGKAYDLVRRCSTLTVPAGS